MTEVHNEPPIEHTVNLIDHKQLALYIQKVVLSLLDSSASLLALQNLLEEQNSVEQLKKVISDPQSRILFVDRSNSKDEVEDNPENHVFTLASQVFYSGLKSYSIAFIKKYPVLDADKDLSTNFLILSFGEGSACESLHSTVGLAMIPYFKSYSKESSKNDRDNDKMATNVEKKMTELEVGLLHLQHNIDIPDVNLSFHPLVLQVIKQCNEQGKKAKVSDFEDRLEDAQFLNALQACVNKWTKEIQKVTKLDRDPTSGTALQEITFWTNFERSLLRIQEKRNSHEVNLSLDILKQAKRFHAILSFDTDTGLQAAIEKVNDYSPLIKDFPLNDLLSATEIEKIDQAISSIFSHMKKIRNSKYPVTRAHKLTQAFSNDLMNQLFKVLSTRRLLHIPFDAFDKIMSQCQDVFRTWEDESERQQQLMREIIKKKREEPMNRFIWRTKWAHKTLQTRLENMRTFRHQHDQLRQVISRVLRPDNKSTIQTDAKPSTTQPSEKSETTVKKNINLDCADAKAIDEVDSAYELVKEVDCLDISKEGQEAWESAIKRYDEKIDQVESKITTKLRDLLGTAKNANEMFRYFSRFNALFIRPHIRGAIRQYQAQLIERVKVDIEALHEKFKQGYRNTAAFEIAKTIDIPPVAGSIIWVKQIENQLNMYLNRVEDVLGKGWEQHRDGQTLKLDGDSFKAKLDVTQVFHDWCKNVQEQQNSITGRIFSIDPTRTKMAIKDSEPQTKTIYKLRVNFHKDIITLAKEVRHMKSLGFRVPLPIVNFAHQTNHLYPYGISLIQSVRTYEDCCHRIEECHRHNIGLLLVGIRQEVRTTLNEGFQLLWDSFRIQTFVQRLCDQVVQFQEKVEELLHTTREIDVQLKALDTCVYSDMNFSEILKKIQKLVDDLSLHKYSNLSYWTNQLDCEVQDRLVRRLENALYDWVKALRCNRVSDGSDLLEENEADFETKSSNVPKLKQITHELRITNQRIHLQPPIQSAEKHIMNELDAWQNHILSLPRIQHSRYQVGLETEKETEKTYRNLISKLPKNGVVLHEAYHAINASIEEARDYVKTWTSYQSLWDLQSDQVYNLLGNDIEKWMNILDEIKSIRKHFDVPESQKDFGPVIIVFGKVQSKVSLKYDNWHKDIVSKFGSNLGTEMNEFYTQINKARLDLERQSIDTGSTSDAVNLITYTQSLKRKMNTWEKQVGMFVTGQAILYRDRFQFPNDWRDCELIKGEWSAFQEIMRRKEASINNQMSSLQVKIVSEDKIVEQKTADLLATWEKERPVQGNTKPEDAVQVLSVLETKFKRLKEDRENIQRAKEALFLTDPGVLPPSEEKIVVAQEELHDLKTVWGELSSVWSTIEQLKDSLWQTVQPRKLRTNLEEMLNQLKTMPPKFKHYASYEHIKSTLQSYCKVNSMVIDMKSEALKERHWLSLMRKLNVKWIMPELTLGQVWDIDLIRNEAVIREILLVAQGEKALEEFLRQVTQVWKNYELELIPYQNKCRLIKGWDDLFTKVKEHINSLVAMKFSPYFKQFEEEASSWEDKLNRVNALFDVWIDVQRRWVYLDGIFAGSADIKTLLPQESQRFLSVSTEFLGLMKKVAKSPLVVDVLNIPNVQRQLERLADLLNKIQRSLGEYLEKQRSSFPRFYFVGDEDLLEIIGNSKNVPRLQKHFKKMFAGVNSIQLNEDNTIITGLLSKETESVQLVNPISLTDNPIINDWLILLEKQMRLSLATYLGQSINELQKLKSNSDLETSGFLEWCDKYQAQLVVLASQVIWSESVEAALNATDGNTKSTDPNSPLNKCLSSVESMLNVLADSVLYEQPIVRRRKLEQLIIEHVHQRDIIRMLIRNDVTSAKHFTWISQMRFYFNPKQADPLKQVSIEMANAKFWYGFEYLGIVDRLVQTPLTDRCYLTMTQALEARLGGSPFGPAGTGKTESVKALGIQLGRFVLVFNCDETFDFHAMGRIFVGLCQVGAWGCFDEFNRLEERMLSAVSQQIQGIQESLREMAINNKEVKVELLNRQVSLNPDMAIFITMNPGYAGRSNLPDNLKKLFRSLAMTQPDRQLIAQVMLYSQGFRFAELLAGKVVPFFKLCDEQLSPQSHYDFGLRALKSVLVSAGNVKRDRIKSIKAQLISNNEVINESSIAGNINEQEILIQSVMETLVPKLVADDIPLLYSLLTDVFPGIDYQEAKMEQLRNALKKICKEMFLVYPTDENPSGKGWVEKILQLYQISNLHHGLMMVGPSGSGKTTAWKVLLKALEKVEGVEGVAHVINPKSISKDSLYGSLDPNTREWSDGLFTHILRKIIDNIRGESSKRQWIIFDGDVDPEWVENLNSVLDDNKLLTLPNGERLAIPPNVRIMFEVQDLKYATLATVSRCGMVWFSEDVLSTEMILEHYILSLQSLPIDEGEDENSFGMNLNSINISEGTTPLPGDNNIDPFSGQENQKSLFHRESPTMQVQRDVASSLHSFFQDGGLVSRCLEFARTLEHIMDFTRLRALTSLFSIIKQIIRSIIAYNQMHMDFPMSPEQTEAFVTKSLINGLVWAMTGDSKLVVRNEMSDFIRKSTTVTLPPSNQNIIDFEVDINGEWQPWTNKVPQIEVDTHKIDTMDVVIPTLDTVRHETLLYTWLAEHRPMLLCGPPGSGKTMTLFSALRSLPDREVIGLNFSSATTPELMMKTFDQYCEYRKTPNGLVLAPQQLNKWLVFFCDEINLPDEDKYGTQRVISFLRQIVENGGFYQTKGEMQWVSLERIQFVGACNPPTDPGRKPLSHRFLRHVPIIYVDYPGETSLKQIYGTFNRAMLRPIVSLRSYADSLTEAMVEFYLLSQNRFTVDMQPHYIYSPREMTRWVRGIHEVLKSLDNLDAEGLVRIWAHEALRLFQDRLVEDVERQWTDQHIDEVAMKYFPNIDKLAALQRPILFSNWLSKEYSPVDQEALRDYVKARLKVFYEEELDVQLVLFNQVLDHVLRIDRVFKQSQGHLLLIGVSGAGKTTLSRFVSWINGLSVFQVKVHNGYTAEDFDDDLRNVLRRAGCKGEKITFIMDESNVMDSSFLERMNTLLANGEVPGLFEGDEFTTLMTQCKDGAAKEGLMIDSHEELYKWFTNQICRNLHVVFTMNPSENGLKDRASTSPALFNRCVLNWFGDWSFEAYYQVGKEFTNKLDLDVVDFKIPDFIAPAADGLLPEQPTHRDMVVNAFVFVHRTLYHEKERISKRGGRVTCITPRHFLDFIHHFVKLIAEKRSDLEEQQLHLNIGLQKIKETVSQVEVMQASLKEKRQDLETMNDAANSKLQQMLHEQQEVDNENKLSQKLQQDLAEQEVHINQKRSEVMDELSKVEPAVNEAKQAVEGIRKKDIQELRALRNPPAVVKMTLESICLLMGEKSTEWRQLLSFISKDTFVPNIINFDTDKVTDEIRETMKKKYLSNPDYNFDKVNRASSACGPMVKWAIAQINYADILKKVDPLRRELKDLESKAKTNQEKAEEVKNRIAELEVSSAKFREEYASLVSQANEIKADLSSVESKVLRSVALIQSLSDERARWDMGSETFSSQMQTIIGDCLLCAAFMAYCGYFDQNLRASLFGNWIKHLEGSKILFRNDLARVEYLSNPEERLRWKANSLPDDELCTENAICLKRFNRYPLIIDPSGQATEFILNEYKDKKITKTSFHDGSFRKTLESALRFGTPLLVQDVEAYDPILNPVLNREVRRTGGRTLITLGDQDIDLSPTFTIFLSTRDPSVDFPTHLCSRVTFVNFTVTRSSLQSQCLNAALKAERPDVDKKRSDLLKVQGEFQLKLRSLEKELLASLNDAKGNLLEDDNIITRLEKLKKEAAEITDKVKETDSIMEEVEKVSNQYINLATACSSIYFMLEGMNQIHFLYQFSLQYLLDMYNFVLTNNPNLKDVRDSNQRLQIITKDLFQICYNRTMRGMLHNDQITFAVLLARIFLRGGCLFGQAAADSAAKLDPVFDYFLKTANTVVPDSKIVGGSKLLSLEQAKSLSKIKSLKIFENTDALIDENSTLFKDWIRSVDPESNVPIIWDAPSEFQSGPLANMAKAMFSLLVIQCLRPDRVLASAHQFVYAILGTHFLEEAQESLELGKIVEDEMKPSMPILLCAAQGYDPSGQIEEIAAEKKSNSLTSIAIGSAEGYVKAETALTSAAKSGRWVMLKNVHLAPSWLTQLEKKLHNLSLHQNFRLFLTMEFSNKIPVNLIRSGRVFVFEPPPGIKASLTRTLASVPSQRMCRAPAERTRLYFLLAWFNAVVLERLRYVPLGWSKKYEFNEADLRSACDTIDSWIDTAAKGRENIAPEKVPWEALRTLIGQCIYGGKIDNSFDDTLMKSFLNNLFTVNSFEHDFALVKDIDGVSGKNICIPDGFNREDFLAWARKLPDTQTPSWLGLPNNAEMVLLTNLGSNMIVNLMKMQQALGEEDIKCSTTEKRKKSITDPNADTRPQWMLQLIKMANEWISIMPKKLKPLIRTAENIKDPMYRCFEREINSGVNLLNEVLKDLGECIEICSGKRKPTNHHRQLMSELVKGIIPVNWKRYSIPNGLSVIQWIGDFTKRIEQLVKISDQAYSDGFDSLKTMKIWLGGLFMPEAYITATRQSVAQTNQWALEELYLECHLYKKDDPKVTKIESSPEPNSFLIQNLRLLGAEPIDKDKIKLSKEIFTEMPITLLRWIRVPKNDQEALYLDTENSVRLPVYMNGQRSIVLFTLKLNTEEQGSNFHKRGVAVISSALQ